MDILVRGSKTWLLQAPSEAMHSRLHPADATAASPWPYAADTLFSCEQEASDAHPSPLSLTSKPHTPQPQPQPQAHPLTPHTAHHTPHTTLQLRVTRRLLCHDPVQSRLQPFCYVCIFVWRAQAGDVFIVPDMWGHASLSHEPSVSFAVHPEVGANEFSFS